MEKIPTEKIGTQKRSRGRPSKFDLIDKDQVRQLVEAGWDDSQVSAFFKVTEQTFNNWKKKNKDFFESLKNWKIEADKKVEKTLYQRALGYSFDEVTYEKTKTGGLGAQLSGGEIEHIKHVDTYKTKIVTKHIAPDVTAQIFWLKNRQPEQWRDKQEHEHSGKILLSAEERNAVLERVRSNLPALN